MNKILIIVGFALVLSGCCAMTGGPTYNTSINTSVSASGGNTEVDKCLAGCANIPASIGICKAGCFTSAAENSLDPAICSNINYLTDLDTANATFWFNTCVTSVAENKPDASICNSIPVGINRDNCIQGVVFKTNNAADCEGMNNSDLKSQCVTYASGK